MNPILRHAIQKLFQITHRNECKNCIIRLAIEKVGGNMQILHLGKHFLAHKSTNLKKKKKITLCQDGNPAFQKRTV